MNDPVANGQLELACRLGCVDDIAEALEEGADINCNGYSPIFIAIQNADRAVLEELVKHDPDVAVFEIDSEKGDPVDQLMAMAPKQDDDEQSENAEGMAELDAKMIRAFHRMISNKGIAEPIIKKRGDDFDAFADGLRSIAAEECHAVVREFIELTVPTTAESEAPEVTLAEYLKDPENSATLETFSARYTSAAEEEEPGELLKDYLKERKKVV